MLLYILSLLLGITGSAGLYWAFSRSLERNRRRQNKRPISYLAPVFLSICLVLFMLGFVAPRLQDLVSLAAGDLQVQEVRLDSRQIGWLTLEVDSRPYCYNRFQYNPQPSLTYRMTALPNSRHVLMLEPIGENITTGG